MGYKIYEITEDGSLFDLILTNQVLQLNEAEFSVPNILQCCHNQNKDYKFLRSRLKEVALNWETLSDKDKQSICYYRATDEDTCKQILGGAYEFWSTNFGIESKKCREYRLEVAKTILIKNIALEQRYIVLGIIAQNALDYLYVVHGLEGTNDNDVSSGIFDWVEGTGDFIGTGLKDMQLTMINGITQPQMIEKIMNCLRLGEY